MALISAFGLTILAVYILVTSCGAFMVVDLRLSYAEEEGLRLIRLMKRRGLL